VDKYSCRPYNASTPRGLGLGLGLGGVGIAGLTIRGGCPRAPPLVVRGTVVRKGMGGMGGTREPLHTRRMGASFCL
jgi:hypothetical protein